MTKNKFSIADFARIQYRYNTLQVFWLTGLTDTSLFDLMYDTGLEWLRRHTKADEETLSALLVSDLVWNWWCSEWYYRDNDRVLASLYHAENTIVRLTRYRNLHHYVFKEDQKLYKDLEQSYSEIIGAFNKRNNQKSKAHVA